MEMCYTPLLPHRHLRADDDIHRACLIVTCLVSDELTFRKFTHQTSLVSFLLKKQGGKLESERFFQLFQQLCTVSTIWKIIAFLSLNCQIVMTVKSPIFWDSCGMIALWFTNFVNLTSYVVVIFHILFYTHSYHFTGTYWYWSGYGNILIER